MNDHAVANRHIVAQRVRAGIAVRAVVTISALFAGCGGSGQPNTVVRTVTAPPATVTATTPTTTATTATPTDCNALGINSGRLREGTCTKGGRMFTIVNKSSTLRLRTLTATLSGFRSQDSLSSSGASATANGRFVIISLTITNKLDTPQTFDQIAHAQTFLSLANKNYTEDFSAENGPDQQSFVANQLTSNGIQPGESKTGDVVFDVPPSTVAELDRTGNLFVLNFGSDTDNPTGTIGVFRTYH